MSNGTNCFVIQKELRFLLVTKSQACNVLPMYITETFNFCWKLVKIMLQTLPHPNHGHLDFVHRSFG